MLVVLPASSAVATEKLSEFEPMEGLKVLLERLLLASPTLYSGIELVSMPFQGKDYGKSRMR